MLLLKIGIFILGLVAIVKGADLFTDSAVTIAEKTGISKVIIGATMVSFATTFPEFAVSVYASWTGHSSMSLGNTIGSNIFNIGVISGLTLLLSKSSPTPPNFSKEASFLCAGGILTLILAINGKLTPIDGILLFIILITYIIYLINYSATQKKQVPLKTATPDPLSGNIVRFIGGAIAVILGSRIVVNTGVWLAKYFEIPEILIALTFVAMGTSLPELVTSITSMLKGYQELSIGNIVGAGILNLCWVTATASIIHPINITQQNLMWDFSFMLVLIFLLKIYSLKKKLSRVDGVILLTIYFVYLTIIINTTKTFYDIINY